MKSTLIKFLTALFLCVFITACSPPSSESPPAGYVKYVSNGVALYHPKSWALAFDSEPGLYSNRAIAFTISEFSTMEVHIIKPDQLRHFSALNLENYTSKFEKILNLKSSTYNTNIARRMRMENGISSSTISWKNTMLGDDYYELTIVEHGQSGSGVFIIFNVSNEDIQATKNHLEPIFNNLTINP